VNIKTPEPEATSEDLGPKTGFSYQSGNRVFLLDCPIENLSLEETILNIHKIIYTRRPHQHCVVNAGKLVLMNREPKLRKIVRSCSLINADGQSVVWALKLIGRPIPERVTGIDLMERLMTVAHEKAYRVFFLGAQETVLNRVIDMVRFKYPHLVVAGYRNGYFSDPESSEVVQAISESKADILFVAMGSPKKEYWLADNMGKLNVPFCMGVGGSFDVISGKTKRAPKWVRDIGMEWFFRFMQEPRRLWKRYIVGNFVFIYLVANELIKRKVALRNQSREELSGKEIT